MFTMEVQNEVLLAALEAKCSYALEDCTAHGGTVEDTEAVARALGVMEACLTSGLAGRRGYAKLEQVANHYVSLAGSHPKEDATLLSKITSLFQKANKIWRQNKAKLPSTANNKDAGKVATTADSSARRFESDSAKIVSDSISGGLQLKWLWPAVKCRALPAIVGYLKRKSRKCYVKHALMSEESCRRRVADAAAKLCSIEFAKDVSSSRSVGKADKVSDNGQAAARKDSFSKSTGLPSQDAGDRMMRSHQRDASSSSKGSRSSASGSRSPSVRRQDNEPWIESSSNCQFASEGSVPHAVKRPVRENGHAVTTDRIDHTDHITELSGLTEKDGSKEEKYLNSAGTGSFEKLTDTDEDKVSRSQPRSTTGFILEPDGRSRDVARFVTSDAYRQARDSDGILRCACIIAETFAKLVFQSAVFAYEQVMPPDNRRESSEGPSTQTMMPTETCALTSQHTSNDKSRGFVAGDNDGNVAYCRREAVMRWMASVQRDGRNVCVSSLLIEMPLRFTCRLVRNVTDHCKKEARNLRDSVFVSNVY